MSAMEYTFEFEGVAITVQSPNGFSRVKKWNIARVAQQIEDATIRAFAMEISYHLANTVKVDGDLGFPVPLADFTADNIKAFCDGLGQADELLLLAWDNALFTARALRNDPDLLPTDEVDEKN